MKNTSSLSFPARLALVVSLFSLTPLAQDASTAISTTAPPTSTAPANLAPECATSCIQSSQDAQSQCAEADQACLCEQSPIISDAISSCLKQTNSCSDEDLQAAVAYYPRFCAQYSVSTGSAPAETGSGGIVSAAGEAPTQISRAPASDLVLIHSATGTATMASSPRVTSVTSHDGTGTGLTVPAILGVALGILAVVVCIIAVVVCIYVRRRQTKRRTRLAFLDSEFGDNHGDHSSSAVQRPTRCGSVQSQFRVQPAPVQKDFEGFDFGISISRTSTLVSIGPPPPAKLNTEKDLPAIQPSTQHVEDVSSDAGTTGVDNAQKTATSPLKQQRASVFKKFLDDSGNKMRASFRSSRSIAPAAILPANGSHRNGRNVNNQKRQTKSTSNLKHGDNPKSAKTTKEGEQLAVAEEEFDENNKI